MPQDKQFATAGTDAIPIVQVREEPQWPFPTATDLQEDRVIAGIVKEPGREKLSIRQAMHRGLLTHGTGLALLEHQAASGYIVDAAKNRMLSVRDAKNAGLVDREHFNTLLIAEKAVTGYTDPFSGNKISLFQAMKKGLIIKDHGIRLLEAQVATGGLIHPMHSHRLPVEVAYKWGYLDTEIFHLISDPANHTKRCFDPNARENLTYLQLLSRCVLDPDTGLLTFQVMDKGSIHLDENMRKCLKSATTKVHTGLFQPGQQVSVWDLLFSRYVPRHKRQELLRQYKAGTITIEDMTQVVTGIVTEAETEGKQRPTQETSLPESKKNRVASERERTDKSLMSRMINVSTGGLRGRKVSVWDMLHSRYIPKGKRKELLKLYRAGVLTIDQMETVVTAIVAKMEELEEEEEEKKKKKKKKKAVPKELGHGASVGLEQEGRFDPQEAQVRQSLQLICIPVEVGEFKGQTVPVLDLLYSKYFPQDKRQQLMEMYRTGILSPAQMMAAVSGALEKAEGGKKKFLVRVKSRSREASGSKEAKGADSSAGQQSDEMLKAHLVTLPAGEFQGQQLSVWDLLFSQYLTKDKREELLQHYRGGKYNVQELASMLTVLASLHDLFHSLEQMTTRTGSPPKTSLEEEVEEEEEEDGEADDDDDDDDDDDEEQDRKDKVLKSRMVEVPVGELRGRKVSLWDLLHSKYFPEKKRKEVLKLYRIGILTADQMETVVTTVVTKVAEEVHQASALPSLGAGALKGTGSVGLPKDHAPEGLTFEFPLGEFQGRRVSMWDLLFSSYVPESKRQDLLARYFTGALSSPEMVTRLTSLIIEAHTQRSAPGLPHAYGLLHPETPYMLLGPSHGHRASMHDLLYSQDHEAHKAGQVTYSEITMTTTVVQGPEQHKQD